jgi:hypothetical protein
LSTSSPERDWRKWGVPAVVVALLLLLGVAGGLWLGRTDNQTAANTRAVEENQRVIQQTIERLADAPSATDVRRLITILESRTGTRDAPMSDTGGGGTASPFASSRPEPSSRLSPLPRPSTIRDPLPQESPSPGTLKPLLCALFPQTMADLRVDCESDTFVLCDLTGLSCPPPPEQPTPPPAPTASVAE